MRPSDSNRVETWISGANPYPDAEDLRGTDLAERVAEATALRITDPPALQGRKTMLTRPRPETRGSKRTLGGMAAASAAILVVAIVGAIVTLRFADAPPAALSPIPTTAIAPVAPDAAATESTVPTTTVASATIDGTQPILWHLGAGQLGDGFQDSSIEAIAVGGPGLVAVGSHQAQLADGQFAVDAAVWVSADSETWQRVASPSFGTGADDPSGQRGTQWMSDVTTQDGRIVAVGYDGFSAAVWTSVDGLGWDRVVDVDLPTESDDSALNAVVTHAGTYIAVGRHGADGGVWLSSDGLDWTRVTDDALGGNSNGGVQLWDVGTFADGLIAVGGRGFDNPGSIGSFTPFVAVSADGSSWESVPVLDEGSGGRGLVLPQDVATRSMTMLSVASVQDRTFILGLVGSRDAILLASDDGERWTRVPLPEMHSPARVATSRDRLVVVGQGERGPSVFVASVDMTTWSKAPVSEMGDARDVLSWGDRLLLVGAWYGPDGAEFRAGTWTGLWDE